MPKAAMPKDESDRICALRQCCVLDSEPEAIFDDVTRLAARICDAPIALVSLVDAERQWFKSAFGLDVKETHRDWAFCAHAILGEGPLVIADATLDPRTSDNPLVVGPPHIRFYAGIPMRSSEGHAMGTLCVIDTKPRELSAEQMSDLRTLADQVRGQLELRSVNGRLAEEKLSLLESHQRMVQIAAHVPGVVYQYLMRPDGSSCFPYVSEGIREIYRVSPEDVRFDASSVLETIHPQDRDDYVASIGLSARSLQPWMHEYRARFQDGEVRWLYGNATPIRQPDGSTLWHGFITDITRKRTERDEAQGFRAQLQALIDASTQVAIIATDLKGVITVFNTGAEQMLGYMADEMVGRQTPRRIHLESEVLVRGEQLTRETGREVSGFDAFVEYARQGRHDAREWTYVHKDGSHLTVNLVVTSIRDSDNTLTGFLGVATDVTAARQMERELQTEQVLSKKALSDSEERYKLVVRSSSAGIFDWDVKTDQVFYAPRFKEMLGYDQEEFPNTRSAFFDVLHPNDHEAVRNAVKAHFSCPQTPYDIEYRLRTKSGEYRFFRARGLAVFNQQGEACRMVGSIIDITDRKRAEAALKEREEAYRALFHSVPAGVFVCNSDGALLRYNRRAAELWGREPQLGIEKYCGALRLYRPDGTLLPHESNPVIEVIRTGNPIRGVEVIFERPDGSRIPVVVNFDVTRNTAGEIDGSVVSFDDISYRTQAENELIAARETAEAANRTKSDFLANMSHEIRTPLTSILGYADLLTEHGLTDDERDSHVATIKRSGDHLLTIINDILDLSKIEAGKMTVERIPFSPADVVREVLCYFQEQALTKKLTLTAETAGPIPRTICSDPVRVRQILVNLVGNAIKFTESGGIKVFVRLVAGDENKATQLAFDVVDTGIGISDEERTGLFAPFVQADTSTTRKFGGTGLGLTICRRMAQLLDGDISLTSTAGQGSTFTATVATGPLEGIGFIARIVERESQSVASSTAVRLTGRILLAEDSPVNQHLIKTLLTKAGAVVDVVENGKLALDQALAGPDCNFVDGPDASIQSYDLVLMDMQMPILDGCSATRELRNRGFKTPIVALTANAMAEDRQKCFDAGCDDFITKPVNRDRLLEVCHDWISRHRIATLAIVERSEIPMAVPSIDQAALFQLVDNDLDLLENVVQLLINDSSTLMERARRACSAGDLQQVASAAHRIKGAVGIVKAEPAFQSARSLEALANSQDLEGAKTQLAGLQQELDRLYPSLLSLIAK